jgi:photosystem II stability/assembly factor-like uncharacterized protein
VGLAALALGAGLGLALTGGTGSPRAATAPAQNLAWQHQDSHSSQELVGVFSDGHNGWLVGGESGGPGTSLGGLTVIRHSADGGSTWQEDAGAKAAEALAVGHEMKQAFVVGNDVWLIGEDSGDHGGPACSPGTASEKIIIHSGDGGATWTRQTSNKCSDLESIYMSDSQHGIISVTDSTFLVTSNGGQTWTSQATGVSCAGGGSTLADSMAFPPSSVPPNQREGWAADACIAHTMNGGQTWTEEAVTDAGSNPVNGSWEQVTCVDSTHCWAVRENGYGGLNFARRDPASGTWKAIAIDASDAYCTHAVATLHAVVFLDANHGFVMGESGCNDDDNGGVMFETTDGGTTWTIVEPPGGTAQISENPPAYALPGANRAWVVGASGTLITFGQPIPAAPAAVTQTVTHTNTVAAPTPPASVHCTVPDLEHKKLRRATAILQASHCGLGNVTRSHGGHGPRRVLKETPEAGTILADNAPVSLRLRRGH